MFEVVPPQQDYRETFGDPASLYVVNSEGFEARAVAVINGTPFNLKSFAVEANAHGASDSATIVTAMAGNPDFSLSLQSGLEDGSVIAEIYAGFPAMPTSSPDTTGMSVRFFGIIQSYDADPGEDEWTFQIQSLGALLTAGKITTAFGQSGLTGGQYKGTQGFTTVQFVKYVAQKYNLKTNISLRGQPAPMVKVYAARQWVGVRNVRILDLLIACAELDNADVFVDRLGVLNYVAPTDIGRNKVALQWGRDFKAAKGTHAPQFSKTIRVEVTSYTPKNRQANVSRLSVNASGTATQKSSQRTMTTIPVFGSTAALQISQTYNSDGSFSVSAGESESTGGSANSGFSQFKGEDGIETYKFNFPGLTIPQCNALAVQLWAQISRFEYLLDFSFPVTPERLKTKSGDDLLDIKTLYQISGLPASAFNNNTDPGVQVLSPVVPPAAGSIDELLQRGPNYIALPPDVPAAVSAVFQSLKDSRYYYQRRYTERFSIDEGWIVDVTAVNHPLPQSGENSMGLPA